MPRQRVVMTNRPPVSEVLGSPYGAVFDDEGPASANAPQAISPTSRAIPRLPSTAALKPKTIMLGALEIVPGARTVMLDGVSIDLGSRAFDLLMALVDANGGILSKESIISQVWPTTTVVDSNLKVQLSILRRALGVERWRIKTVSGRGYHLVMDEPSVEVAVSSSPSVPPQDVAGKPLIIVLDGDPATQALMTHAVSELVKTLDGITRFSVISNRAKTNKLIN